MEIPQKKFAYDPEPGRDPLPRVLADRQVGPARFMENFNDFRRPLTF